MLVIDVGRRKTKKVNMGKMGAVESGISFHMYELNTSRADVYSDVNAVVLSAGPFAHPEIPGANRGVLSFRSPLTGSFMVSSAGNVGRYIVLTGNRSIAILGRSDVPVVVAVVGSERGTTVHFLELDDMDSFYGGLTSFSDYVRDGVSELYAGMDYRSVLAGPASENTDYGLLASFDIKTKVWDYFGRGGGGSVLVRAHNVYGVVLGGSYAEEVPVDLKKAVNFDVIAEKTKKYRYIEKEGIGGTVSNWLHLKGLLPAYNWKTIYLSPREREHLWEDYIRPTVERVKKLFTSGEIRSRTCGERCPAVCKKIYTHKIDYEPITSLGSQLGVFDLDNILSIVSVCDEMGMDAIEAGNVVAWFFELSGEGLYGEGLGAKMEPFEVDEDRQTELAVETLRAISRGEYPELSSSIRRNASEIRSGSEDFGVYVPFSGGGSIVPPQYRVPGFFIPLPLHGKFMTFYGSSYVPPRELGRKVWERFIAELMVEDAGFCRFHRGWVESVLPDWYGKGARYDAERLASMIFKYNKEAGAEPLFPESRRARDVVSTFLELWGKQQSLDAFFNEVKQGMAEARVLSLK